MWKCGSVRDLKSQRSQPRCKIFRNLKKNVHKGVSYYAECFFGEFPDGITKSVAIFGDFKFTKESNYGKMFSDECLATLARRI